MGYLGAGIAGMLAGIVLWEFVGQRLKRAVGENEKIREMRQAVRERASKIKDISKEQYDQIIDQVSDKYARVRGISQHEFRDAVSDLKRNWAKMKDAWNRPDPRRSENDNPSLSSPERGDNE